MSILDIYSQNGEKLGQTKVAEGVLDAEINESLLHQVVVAYLANQRQGTASTKTRAEVAGSGAKLFRQKGTGRARMGDIRSPLRVHGGIAFGPKPRSYRQNTPKKMLKGAMLSAIADKFQSNSVMIIDRISFEKPTTKGMIKSVKALGLNPEEKILLVLDAFDRNVYLSGRNIPNLNISIWSLLNVYQILRHDRLIITQEALKKLEEKFTVEAEKAEKAEKAVAEV
jgi:large subunit ribosomal protein L4